MTNQDIKTNACEDLAAVRAIVNKFYNDTIQIDGVIAELNVLLQEGRTTAKQFAEVLHTIS